MRPGGIPPCERLAGELLAAMEKDEGGGGRRTGTRTVPVQAPPKLADLGV